MAAQSQSIPQQKEVAEVPVVPTLIDTLAMDSIDCKMRLLLMELKRIGKYPETTATKP